MMSRFLSGVLGICLALAAGNSWGAIVFTQDFSSSSVIANYVSATPNAGQLNAIGSSGTGVVPSIVNDDLRFERAGANVGGFTRLSLGVSPLTAALISMRLSVITATAQTTAAQFQLGDNFTTSNSVASNADVHSRFGLNFNANGSYSFRDIGTGTNSMNFTGENLVSWAVNNSGNDIMFLAPDSAVTNLANDTARLYVGTQLALTINALTPTQSLNDFKFAFPNGTGTVNFDFVQVETLTAVPEPSSLALLTVCGVAGVIYRRRRAGSQVADADDVSPGQA